MLQQLLGIAILLWGLKFFKAYIIFTGVLAGALLGFIIGALVSISSDSYSSMPVIVVILAIVGGAIAWPLQKIIISIAVGTIAALFGFLLFGVLTQSIQTAAIAAALLLIGGVIVAFKLYEHVVVILIAAQAAALFSFDIGELFSLSDLFDLGAILLVTIFAFIVVTLTCVFFAIAFQKTYGSESDDSDSVVQIKRATRKIVGILAFISIIIAAVASSLLVFGGVRNIIGPLLTVIFLIICIVIMSSRKTKLANGKEIPGPISPS